MKTKAHERRDAAKVAEAEARIAATVRQQAFIDHRSADPTSILWEGDAYRRGVGFEQLLWPYNQTRQLRPFDQMVNPDYRQAVLDVETEKLVVLMDYIEANPNAGVDVEILGPSITISGFDVHGDREQFYRIRDGQEIVYFRTCQGDNSIVTRDFFVEAVAEMRAEAARLESWID